MAASSARDVILGRIREALFAGETASAGGADDVLRESAAATPLVVHDLLALFEARLRDYDAAITRAQPDKISTAIEHILLDRGRPRMVAPPGFPPEWLPRGLPVTSDDGSPARELERYAGVLTDATLGIAETGTLVLQATAGQGRRALTLVPDFHLCVVHANNVVASVDEAMERLEATSRLPTTFISGPSATADIEMTRIKGVHGPRFLHVVLVS